MVLWTFRNRSCFLTAWRYPFTHRIFLFEFSFNKTPSFIEFKAFIYVKCGYWYTESCTNIRGNVEYIVWIVNHFRYRVIIIIMVMIIIYIDMYICVYIERKSHFKSLSTTQINNPERIMRYLPFTVGYSAAVFTIRTCRFLSLYSYKWIHCIHWGIYI